MTAAALTLADLRPEVAAFALLMEQKLRENDHKTTPDGRPLWKVNRPGDLFPSLEREVCELRREVNAAMLHIWRRAAKPSDVMGRMSRQSEDGRLEVADVEHYDVDTSPEVAARVGREAADVANFAMMIADQSGALG